MAVCAECGSQQPDGAKYCDQCGTPLGKITPETPPRAAGAQSSPTAAITVCPACGNQVKPDGTFCDNCGARLGSASLLSPPPSARQPGKLVCLECGAQLASDSNFCDVCGTPVEETFASPKAGSLVDPATRLLSPQEPLLPEGGRLVIRVTNVELPFPPGKNEVVIGRRDPTSNVSTDIDLDDHGGHEAGVSRRHARIFVEGDQVFIEDLDSANHTYVNQQELIPQDPHPLNDGDEVRLGHIKLNYYT